MLFSASTGYMQKGYIIPSQVTSISHMWSIYNLTRTRNCEGLILKHKLLKPHPPTTSLHHMDTLFSHERFTAWTTFLVSSQISSKRLYSKASNQELEHDSPCSSNSTTQFWTQFNNSSSSRRTEGTSRAYIQTLQYPQRICLQCADPIVWKQCMLTSAHPSWDSSLKLIFIYCLITKAPFQLLIEILLPIFN